MQNPLHRLRTDCNALIDTKCYMTFKFNILITYGINSYKKGLGPFDPFGCFSRILPTKLATWKAGRNVNNLCIN